MAITLVQSKTGVATTATVNPSFNTTPVSGNLVVLAFAADDYNGTPDTGWTQSTNMEQQGFHGAYIWWRISDGSNPPGGYTIGSATNSAWVMAEFSGVNAVPYDTSNGQFTNSSGASQATPAITPSTGNRLLVATVDISNNADLSGYNITAWSNSFALIGQVGNAGGTTRDGCAMSYRTFTGDGSTTISTTGTLGSTNQSRSGLIISFKESSALNASAFQLDAFQGDAFQAVSGATSSADSVTVDSANLALTGQSITTIDVCPITQANLDLTGQAISTIDVCPITQANLSLSGSNIIELDTIGITQANLSLTGSDIGMVDVTPITQANLSLSGSNIIELDTIGITSADLPLSGSTITVVDAELVSITAANLDLTGQNIIEAETVGITQANLSLAGQAITSIDVTPITAADLALAGQNITESETVGIVSTDLPLQGQSITVTDTGSDTVTIDPGALLLAGSDIRVTDPSLQKDGDADYWSSGRRKHHRVEGETFAEKLRASTDITPDATPPTKQKRRARKLKELAEAEGLLLTDTPAEQLGELATQLRSSAMRRLADKAGPSGESRRELALALAESQKRAQEQEQDEEEALFALGMY